MVKVKFYGRLADALGAKEVDVGDVSTLSELIDALRKQLGDRVSVLVNETGGLRPGILVLINGEAAVFKGGLNAKLAHDDSVVFDTIDIYEVEGGG